MKLIMWYEDNKFIFNNLYLNWNLIIYFGIYIYMDILFMDPNKNLNYLVS